ncbi:MAG: NAD-dependent epimerase/dehydratase family protein, partial [Mesotoga sp.]|uniref:NAD-dependent epimerase/dehydratase family protein n=1 Tax=Mesotoga sp. TaxID=2053577 RepID=UPI00260415C1
MYIFTTKKYYNMNPGNNMDKDQIYLVTGAAGHLGYTIVSQLVSEGRHVRALVLPEDCLGSRLPPEIEIVRGNVLDKHSLDQFFKVPPGVQIYLIHSAGIVTTSLKYRQIVYDVNVQGTKNILEEAIKHHVKKMVYVSSVHAIPELPKGQVIREVEHFDKDLVYGMYSKTKAEATHAVLDAAAKGLDVTVVHPSGICGPNSHAFNYATQLVIDCWKGLLPMGVNGGYDFVDVRDVASGTISSCHKGERGECYILANRYISVKEIFSTFQEITGKKLPRLMAPMWLAKASLPLCSLYYKIKKRLPMFSSYSLYTLNTNAYFSSDKARLKLGYIPRPF